MDVRDAAAFGAHRRGLNAAGGIAGVIHGAGAIEDKLPATRRRSRSTTSSAPRLKAALTLARNWIPRSSKFFSLYASITSRYGNRGQSDYAAANEVLSKLACDLDRKWPGRVVSVRVGPWAKGAWSSDLQKHLAARGLKLIEPPVGAGFAVDGSDLRHEGRAKVLGSRRWHGNCRQKKSPGACEGRTGDVVKRKYHTASDAA